MYAATTEMALLKQFSYVLICVQLTGSSLLSYVLSSLLLYAIFSSERKIQLGVSASIHPVYHAIVFNAFIHPVYHVILFNASIYPFLHRSAL